MMSEIDSEKYPVYLDTFQIGIILSMIEKKREDIVSGRFKEQSPGAAETLKLHLNAIESQFFKSLHENAL